MHASCMYPGRAREKRPLMVIMALLRLEGTDQGLGGGFGEVNGSYELA